MAAGRLTIVDHAAFAGYCLAVARWRQATEALAEQVAAGEVIAGGTLIEGPRGGLSPKSALRGGAECGSRGVAAWPAFRFDASEPVDRSTVLSSLYARFNVQPERPDAALSKSGR